MPYTETFMSKSIGFWEYSISIWRLWQLGPIWRILGLAENDLFFRWHIFHAHVSYCKVLVFLQSSGFILVIWATKHFKKKYLLRTSGQSLNPF